MEEQLTLPFIWQEAVSLSSFYPGDNQALLDCLQDFIQNPDFVQNKSESYIYLWGSNGVGRSHLLQACCQQLAGAVYLNLTEQQELRPEILLNLEQVPLVCLDDFEGVIGQAAWEEALFHCYNRIRESKTRLLIAAAMPPAALPCQLADLRSRLTSGLIFQVIALNDAQKLQALSQLAQARGLPLPQEVAEFLMRHYPRDMPTLFSAVQTLDQASLSAHHPLTIPFVKRVLGI